MAWKSVEERLDSLEKKNRELEKQNKGMAHEIERLQAFVEIQNLMSKYEYLHTSENHQETADMFTKKAPDVRSEMQWGVYEGNESIQRLYVGYHTQDFEEAHIGRFGILPVTNGIVEVAGDGKTAKGMWISTGFVMMAGDKPRMMHAWCKYGIDFKKEDGKWKFWHVQVYDIMFIPWDAKSLAEHKAQTERELPANIAPDRPPTYKWSYSLTGKTENMPPPPEPYETWDERTSMTTFGILRIKPKSKMQQSQ